MGRMEEIARRAGVSTTTVYRVFNKSNKVHPATSKKVRKIAEKLELEAENEEQQREVTIKDVARLAGVSEATVSRVINKSDRVRQETRQLVEKVIDKLEYRVNVNARHLRQNKTRALGLLIPDILISFYGTILKGIQNLAYAHDFNVMLLETDSNLDKELSCVEFLKDRRVEGMIYIGTDFGEERMEMLNSCDFPIVAISGEYEEIGFPSVRINNFQAAYDMTEYLIEKGYQKLGFISGSLKNKFVGRGRLQGFKQALLDYKLPVIEDWIKNGYFSYEDGHQAMKEILTASGIPEAVFVAGDEMAIGALRQSLDSGYRVPKDIGIAGFDNLPITRYTNPRLTTVSQPIYQIGYNAVEMLIKQIEGEELQQYNRILDHNLMERDSV